MTTKHCSKCNAGFECRADATGCWCEAYTISPGNLQLLKNNFADCLCLACLSLYQDKTPDSLQSHKD